MLCRSHKRKSVATWSLRLRPVWSFPAASPITILAVDDDPLVLANTAALAEDLGHTVIKAASGQDALDLLSDCPGLDLVITDQAMPGMTGVQLAEELQSLRPGLPVRAEPPRERSRGATRDPPDGTRRWP